jgi:hypothetical protein
MRLVKRLYVPLSLAVLVLIPLWDLLWLPGDQVIAGNDLQHMFLQWWRFAVESLRAGELPLWNPFLFSGVPFLANPQPALLYPPVWLLLLLPAAKVAGLLFALHIWLAGLGMYGWLRSESADRAGALFGAVVYAFCGYFAVRIFAGHIGVVMTLAWTPTLLWAFHAALKRDRWTAAILGGLAVALAFLAGHTASLLYVLLVLGAYAMYKAWLGWQRTHELQAGAKPLLYCGVMLLSGVGLAAIQLLPAWELVQFSVRQDTTYSFAAGQSWPPGYLLTLFVPNFFGEPGHTGYWGDGVYEEMIFYVGVLTLVLILALAFRRPSRHRVVPFLLALGGVGLLLALGQYGILHRLAYNFVPLFKATRAPARAGFLFSFSAAALGGLLITTLRQEPGRVRWDLRAWVQGPGPWFGVILAALVILAGFFVFALERDTSPDVGRLWHVANTVALFLLFFLLTLLLLGAWQSGRLSARWGALLAVGLVLLDLWGFWRYVIQPVPVEESAYWRIVSEITDNSEGRVLPWGLGIFEHNKGMAREMENVFGYDPLELERYHAFTTAVADPRAKAYDLLHARYLVASAGMDFPEEAGAPRLLDQRDGIWVYERPTALPAAWLVHQTEVLESQLLLDRINDPEFDPQAVALLEKDASCDLTDPDRPDSVRFYRRGNNHVELDVDAGGGALLVLSEPFYPGWQATVDGTPVPVFETDYVLRGVCIPPGRHQVVFSFSPSSLRIGALISLASALVAAGAGFTLLRRH